MEAVASDIGAHAAKTGMLANAAIVEAVAAAVQELEIPLLVVDPVMIAKSGDRLIDEEAVGMMRSELMRQAFVVTPNIPEAETLAGLRIVSSSDRQEAARRILKLGASSVIIKGGHLDAADILDLLYDGHRFEEFRAPRIAGSNTHGTGCTFAASLASHLALGRSLREAIPLAQEYVAGGIRHGLQIGKGHGPLHHFWRLQ
jgi:hydroxymethylpyrimidine kinase/phosphomethylpyrimidine kinase